MIKEKDVFKVGVLASGRGSNFEKLVKNLHYKYKNLNYPIKIVVLISNKKNSDVLKKSKKYNIDSYCISHKDETKQIEILNQYNVNLIVLAGYMRIISENFISNFQNKIINIHPSLLPSFPGKDAQEQAFNYGVKITGCTVHYVDSGMDTGKIIEQFSVRVNQNDTLETLKKRILKREHSILTKVVIKLSEEFYNDKSTDKNI